MRGIGLLITIVIAAVVGVAAYQAGVAQGLATTGTAVAPAAYYGGPFLGFGLFGFIFPLLFLFLIFGLLRAAFGGGWGGHRYGGWGGPHDHGKWGEGPSRLEEWHKKAHEGPEGTAPKRE